MLKKIRTIVVNNSLTV